MGKLSAWSAVAKGKACPGDRSAPMRVDEAADFRG